MNQTYYKIQGYYEAPHWVNRTTASWDTHTRLFSRPQDAAKDLAWFRKHGTGTKYRLVKFTDTYCEIVDERNRWGRRMNKWHDEVGPLHLLNDDGSPACGSSYYTTTGTVTVTEGTDTPEGCCKRCEKRVKRGG